MTTATEFEGSVVVHLEYSDGPVDEQNHFTGVVSGTDVTLRFDDSPNWRLGSSWSGSLDGTAFTMNLPARNAGLLPAQFLGATVDDYNRAVKQAKPLQR
jgi:hypothetical protein